jgi:hypothetical protein
MDRSALLNRLEEEGYIKSYSNLVKNGQLEAGSESSLAEITDLLSRMDTAPIVDRYIPSESDYAQLKIKYAHLATVPEDDPLYIRQITPFMAITAEGAFIIHAAYGWEKDEKGLPRKHDLSVISYHPSVEMMRKVILKEIDPRDGQQWTIGKINEDPACIDVEEVNVFRCRPNEIDNIVTELKVASAKIYDTDMNDRVLVEIHDPKVKGLYEWRNRNIYYYTKRRRSKGQREAIYDVFMTSAGGKSEQYHFDERNKGIRRLAMIGLVPRVRIAKSVTLSQASTFVEEDFVKSVKHLIHGADPCFETKLERKIKKNLHKPRKANKLFQKKRFPFRPRSMLVGFYLKWRSKKASNIRLKNIVSHAFRRGAGKAAIIGAKRLARDPALVRLIFLLGTAYFAKETITSGVNKAPEQVETGNLTANIALITLMFGMGAWEAISRSVGKTPESLKVDDYRKISEIGPRQHPDYSRHKARKSFLKIARIAFDVEINYSDLNKPDPDAVSLANRAQQRLLERYSPQSLSEATVSEIKIGKYKGVASIDGNGYCRLTIPQMNTVFEWYEPDAAIKGALPALESLSNLYAGDKCSDIYMICNRGVSTRLVDSIGTCSNEKLYAEKISFEMFQDRLHELATDLRQNKISNLVSVNEPAENITPQTKLKRTWKSLLAKKEPKFDRDGTYPYPTIDKLDLK